MSAQKNPAQKIRTLVHTASIFGVADVHTTKQVRLNFRCSEDEAAQMRKLASEAGRSLSDHIRICCLGASKSETVSLPFASESHKAEKGSGPRKTKPAARTEPVPVVLPPPSGLRSRSTKIQGSISGLSAMLRQNLQVQA